VRRQENEGADVPDDVRDATARRPPGYGIDAPYVPLGWGVGAVGCAAAAVLLESPGLWITCAFLALGSACFAYSSLRGKFVVWKRLIAGLSLRGDEHVLDMGCGRGAVLVEVARHVPRGRAVGVDLWRSRDQSGNDIETTRLNAQAAGVADVVDLYTSDLRELPFPDDSFDVVVSSLAIHNIPDRAGRDRAIDEALRVLRPGGRIVIADLKRTGDYAQRLQGAATDVRRRGLGWRMWWSGPWMSTSVVEATASS
jgi:arsenite methyltransferase